MAATPLGEFEVLVLLAVLRLEGGAYPPAVRAEIERRTARSVSRGAVYVTLDRLAVKGLLGSRLIEPADAGHGRPRRLFRVTPRGRHGLRRALAAVDDMRSGLDALLEES
jgi:DNA-binding PadR family transcriptional regulator